MQNGKLDTIAIERKDIKSGHYSSLQERYNNINSLLLCFNAVLDLYEDYVTPTVAISNNLSIRTRCKHERVKST